MKIFLGKNPPDDSYNTVGFRKNIDNVADSGECTEILGPNILDYIPKAEHADVIEHLISKLRHGGKIIIGGMDIISLAVNTFNKTISTSDANLLIYGQDDEPPKVALTCLEDVREIMLRTIKVTKQVPGVNFTIEGQRT
jgi:hypothetical protein